MKQFYIRRSHTTARSEKFARISGATTMKDLNKRFQQLPSGNVSREQIDFPLVIGVTWNFCPFFDTISQCVKKEAQTEKRDGDGGSVALTREKQWKKIKKKEEKRTKGRRARKKPMNILFFFYTGVADQPKKTISHLN